MAVQGKITIKSDVAANVITVLTNACNSLENDVISKLTSAADPLIKAGFLDASLSKIKTQVTSIEDTEKQLIASVTAHMEETNANEDNLYNNFKETTPTTSYGETSYDGNNNTTNEEDLDEDDGKKVNCEKLCEIIPKLDETSKINLLKVINFYKDKDTKLIDLLLDNSKSEELFTLIKKAFGNAIDIEDMTLEEMKKVQKILLDTILSKDLDITEFQTDSILIAKEYLIKICNDNSINPSDLIFDDKYRHTLKQTLKNVYKGNVDNTMTTKEIEGFKNYIDKICLKNNTTAEELIDNKVEILL